MGLTGGFVARSAASDPHFYSGIPKQRIKTVTGILTQDGKRIASGKVLYTLDLLKVTDGNGTSATATGRLVLFSDDSLPRLWKSVISSPAEPAYNENSHEWIAFGNGTTEIITLPAPIPFRLRAGIRTLFIRRIGIMDSSVSALFEALFLGIRGNIEEADLQLFREAGCMHLLALSGMHLTVLTTIIVLVTIPILGRKAGFLLGLVVIGVYIFIVGLKPSLLRAGIMYGLIGAGIISGRRVKGIHTLAAAFIVLALLYPDAVYTLSFQLSFLALFGIMTIGSRLGEFLKVYLPSWIAYPLACSFGAQTATAPLLLSTFGELYPAGLFSSIALTPLITLFMWVGIGMLFLPTSVGTVIGGFILNLLHTVILFIAETIAEMPRVVLYHRADIVTGVIITSVFFCICLIPIHRIKNLTILRR